MARRRKPEERRAQKTDQLLGRIQAMYGCTEEEARRYVSNDLKQAVRVNPLRGEAIETVQAMTILGWRGQAFDWCPNGYTIDEGFEALRDSPLVTEGKIYIQNPSSWLPVVALAPRPGEAVLDMCAAPGGKAAHIAAMMHNEGRLVANDNSRPRLMRLRANLERLGVRSECTLYDATRLGRVMSGEEFDRILLDAPCSGEGLINLSSPLTVDTWSVAHIRRLGALQKRILAEAWQLLRPGGRLVYSTCTMAPEENEGVVDWLLRRRADARTIAPPLFTDEERQPLRCWNERDFHPGVVFAQRHLPVAGFEAFFVAVLEKASAK